MRGDAGDFLVAQAAAHRHAFEVAALLEQLGEAAPVARLDRHQHRQFVQRGLDIADLRGGDLQRVGGVVAREHHAVAVDDGAAVGHRGQQGDAVVLGARQVVVVAHDLQVVEACGQQPEADAHEQRGNDHAQAEACELLGGRA